MARIFALLWFCFVFGQAQAQETILLLGDSLSAGHGIALEASWPRLLERRLASHEPPYRLVNASISGETTAGGKSRLPSLLERHRPKVVILALGANDGLRGLPLVQIRDNLRTMIREAKSRKAQVLLIGMKLPPNYGPDYATGFARLFETLADEEKIPLLPFLLEPIALDASAFQADRLHPTAEAQALLLDHVWPALAPLIAARKAAPRLRADAR